MEQGEQALFEANVHAMHPEMVKLLGRLKFRTSYGQNVLAHSIEISRLAAMIADELGASAKTARRAALLHDLGKLGVSNVILDKPGKLDQDEWTQMRRHPELTVRILERVGAFRDLAATAGAHHERLDGRGYQIGRAHV